MDYLQTIISILSGLAVCIPLVIKLVQTVQAAIKEKNWNTLVEMTFRYMAKAEELYTKGAEKKEWVMGMIKSSAAQINFVLDDESLKKISKMIDDACSLAKDLVKQKPAPAQPMVDNHESKNSQKGESHDRENLLN